MRHCVQTLVPQKKKKEKKEKKTERRKEKKEKKIGFFCRCKMFLA
jgi:hypothetical protein